MENDDFSPKGRSILSVFYSIALTDDSSYFGFVSISSSTIHVAWAIVNNPRVCFEGFYVAFPCWVWRVSIKVLLESMFNGKNGQSQLLLQLVWLGLCALYYSIQAARELFRSLIRRCLTVMLFCLCMYFRLRPLYASAVKNQQTKIQSWVQQASEI